MKTTLSEATTREIALRLTEADDAFARAFPGEPEARQPIHTVYGGAQLFRADLAAKLGKGALDALAEHAPDFAAFGRAFALSGSETLPSSASDTAALAAELARDPEGVKKTQPASWLAHVVRARVIEKLRREPVEDLRIDFEDGFGVRPDAEEDETALRCAAEVARGVREKSLPPFFGIRIKSLGEETRARAMRTLDLFLTALVAEGVGLPPGFLVTLPKVTIPEQVEAAVALFEALERGLALPSGALRMELMIETTQSIIDAEGRVALPGLVRAAKGRCFAAHFGTYDYTAACNVTAAFQSMRHPATAFARDVMQVSLARTGIFVSDGATNVMPVGVHKKKDGALTPAQIEENRRRMFAAWHHQVADVRDSLVRGIYQGWDLHPAQIPARLATVHAFFLEGFDAAADRLANFVERAAKASLLGDVFDDAATGQGLLNYFLRALAVGALSEEEVLARTGLGLDDLRTRSFSAIQKRRAARA